MIPETEFILLDEKIKNFGSFDTGLPKFQKELWALGDKYGITGQDVFFQYMDWKNKNLKTMKI